MNILKKLKGFSLVEAIIMITVLAIVIAVATPMISRKIVNTADIGASLGGANHGRYELFTKEIFQIPTDEDGPDQLWERTIDATKRDGIIVYERKIDADYIRLRPGEPKSSPDNHKSTMYEEITDVKPVMNDKGEIISATKNGKTYYKGGRYIFENKNLVYKKTNDDYSRKKCGLGESCVLDRDKYRIIEGNLTQYFKDNPETNNKLFLIEVTDEGVNPPGFTIPVTSVPWERIYSGEDPIIDRPAQIDPTTGKPTGEFKVKDKIKNLTIHAVGAGGAGGALSADDLNGVIYTKSGMGATNDDIEKMRKILAQRIRDLAIKKGTCMIDGTNMCSLTNNNGSTTIPNMTDDQLVDYGTKDYSTDYDDYNEYNSTLDGKWAYINTSKGVIHVKADTRYGVIFPHDLLDYTIELGAQSQDSVVYEMPRWFDYEDINDAKFWVGEIVHSGDGGDAGTLRVNSTNSDNCLRTIKTAAHKFQKCDGPYSHCHRYGTTTCCVSETATGVCTATGTCQYCAEHQTDNYICPATYCASSYSLDTTYYTGCGTSVQYHAISGCNARCDTTYHQLFYCKRTSAVYPHTWAGGDGGSGVTATVCHLATQEPIEYSSSCGRQKGAPGGGGSDSTQSWDGVVCVRPSTPTATGGQKGQDCTATFNSHYATATGGEGGNPYGGRWNQAMSYIEAPLFDAMPNGDSGDAGGPGSVSSDSGGLNCSEAKGLNGGTGLYNYAFIWTIPFAINTLSFGEAGQEGECETLKINGLKETQSLNISLGVGGRWGDTNGNGRIDINDFKNSKGEDGTDTTIDMLDNDVVIERVLTAKGGKGGNSSYKTDAYDLCFAQSGVCHKDSNVSDVPNVNCCINEKNSRDTKEIISSNPKESLFENLKSLVGNNEIIGIGLGRGGEGVGTRAGLETVYGERKSHNPTGASLSDANRIINSVTINKTTTKNDYKNKLLIPSEFNFKGGDGAVIITW